MSIAEDILELTPGTDFVEDDETKQYWIKEGAVLFRHYPCKGADPASFRFYRGAFGKDDKRVYATCTRQRGGNGATFRALNFAYYTDGNFLWTMGGQIKGADVDSFMVCDDGSIKHYEEMPYRYAYGFARDKAHVYYFNWQGKTKTVRKAVSSSFVSLNDGYFGRDENRIFWGAFELPKANLATWIRMDDRYFFSRDNSQVFHANQPLRNVDYDTFTIEITSSGMPLAKDKSRYFYGGSEITAAEFEKFATPQEKRKRHRK